MRGTLDRARGLLRVVRLLSARQLREHPLRTALTASGVALGVTLYVAVLILNCSTLRYFDDTARAVAGRARLTVVADQAGFPEEVLERVSAVPGVATAVPLVEARATYLEAPGAPPRILMVLGVDLLRETAVRSYRADDQTVVDDPLAFLNQPDSIVLTRAFARAQGLELDSKIDLLTAGGRKRFTVRGLLEPSGPAVAYGGGLALMDVDAARVMFGRQGRTDRIDVVPGEGEDDVALEHRLERALGPGFRVERPETQVDAFERMLGSYQAVLSAFGSLALLVGLLLVANALGIAVVERRREIGLLRAVGASRAAIVVGLLGEGALLGAVGGLGGLAAGWGLARALVGMVSRGLTAQFVTPIYVESLRYEPRQAVTALLLGVLAAVAGAAWPALRAIRITPLAALRPEADGLDDAPGAGRLALRALGLAALLALPIGAALRLDLRRPEVAAAACGCAVLGCLLTTPWLIALLVRGLRALLVRARVPAITLRLASESLLRHPQRSGASALALVFALVLVVTMAVAHVTFRDGVAGWMERTLGADIVVSSSGRVVSLQVQPLGEELGDELARVPGVDPEPGAGVVAMQFSRVRCEGRLVALKAFDRAADRFGFRHFELVDRPAAQAGRELFDSREPTVLVSDNFARGFGRRTGDTIVLESPTGPLTARIVGVVIDFASSDGVVYLSRARYRERWGDPLVTAFGVHVAAGYTPAAVRATIDARFADRGIVTTLPGEARAMLVRALDESLAYTHAIELAALLVGLLALLNTVLSGVVERTRELAMLRAIGMSRRQLRRMLLGESLTLGVAAGLVGAALGVVVSRYWLVSTLTAVLGFTVPVVVPWAALAASVGAALFVGSTTGLAAAERAARISIDQALREE